MVSSQKKFVLSSATAELEVNRTEPVVYGPLKVSVKPRNVVLAEVTQSVPVIVEERICPDVPTSPSLSLNAWVKAKFPLKFKFPVFVCSVALVSK